MNSAVSNSCVFSGLRHTQEKHLSYPFALTGFVVINTLFCNDTILSEIQ